MDTQANHHQVLRLPCRPHRTRHIPMSLLPLLIVITLVALVLAANANATVVAQRGDGLYLVEGESSTEIYEGQTLGMGVSPNGQEVVFTPFLGAHDRDLMLYNIPEETTTVVSSYEEEGMHWKEPRFAPSGTQIIAVSDFGIYAIDTDGTHIRRLTGDKGNPSWPVMSKGGYLAYLDDQYNLWVLDPTTEEEASEPRLIAKTSEYEGTYAYPPSFGSIEEEEYEICEQPEQWECEIDRPAKRSTALSSESDQLLYATNKNNYIFNVKTGEEVYNIPSIHGPEWDTLSSEYFWEAQYNKVYRVNRKTGAQSYEGTTPESPYSPIVWIRSDQPSGEVAIPHAPLSSHELLWEFRPHLKYDSQEPYGAETPWAITNLYGWNEDFTEVEYTNTLRRGGRVLAQPEYTEYMEEEGVKYKPEGVFALSLESLGPTYPAYAPPDENALASSEDFLDEHNDTHMKDSDRFYSPNSGQDESFAFFRPTTDGGWLQYWFFYYYNNGFLGISDHEGDWEMMQVHLNAKTGFLPDEVVYVQHSHANRCLHGEYETEGEAPGPGGSPVVYVANGDHASYPEEGEWESEAPFVNDTVYPNLEEWPSAEVGLPNVQGEEANEEEENSYSNAWLEWPGLWGGSGSSPRGPVFHGTQWEDPTAWAEEAQGCRDNKVSPGPFRAATATRGGETPLTIESALITGAHMVVTYRTAGIVDKHMGWLRMLLTADVPNDGLTPKTVILRGIKRHGRVRLPFRLNPRKAWRVRASVISHAGRSPVVVQTAKRKGAN